MKTRLAPDQCTGICLFFIHSSFRAAFPGEGRDSPYKAQVTPTPFSFCKVEISLQSSFQPGMKLEVANKSNPDTYWVATIITTCGQLLLLRYCGYGDERRADFWCDVMTADLHPVGWCTQNNKVLMPPDGELCLGCEGRAVGSSLHLWLVWDGCSRSSDRIRFASQPPEKVVLPGW